MKKTYIAGPMTGLPNLNFPAFHAVAADLRAMGRTVINPAEINADHHLTWEACMRTDIAALVQCDAIHLLPGWEDSKGAKLEHHIAERLGLTITFAPVPASDLQRLRGEAGVLRGILRELLAVVDTLDCDDPTEWEHMLDLRVKARAAITGVTA